MINADLYIENKRKMPHFSKIVLYNIYTHEKLHNVNKEVLEIK